MGRVRELGVGRRRLARFSRRLGWVRPRCSMSRQHARHVLTAGFHDGRAVVEGASPKVEMRFALEEGVHRSHNPLPLRHPVFRETGNETESHLRIRSGARLLGGTDRRGRSGVSPPGDGDLRSRPDPESTSGDPADPRGVDRFDGIRSTTARHAAGIVWSPELAETRCPGFLFRARFEVIMPRVCRFCLTRSRRDFEHPRRSNLAVFAVELPAPVAQQRRGRSVSYAASSLNQRFFTLTT